MQHINQGPDIWLDIPHAGSKGKFLVKGLVRQVRRFLKKDVRIVVRYRNKILGIYCSTKDKIPSDQRSNVIYEINQSPGFGCTYIGKTDRCLSIRLSEHGTRDDQPMFRHLSSCDKFIDYLNFFSMNELPEYISYENHLKNAVMQSYWIRLD